MPLSQTTQHPINKVAEDGTLRVISNWGELSEAERSVAWRRIAQRNRARLAAVKAGGDPSGPAGDEDAVPSAESASDEDRSRRGEL